MVRDASVMSRRSGREEVQRVDAELGWIERRDDGVGCRAGMGRLPEVAFVWEIEARAGRVEQHADARSIRIRRVYSCHHRDLAGRQPDQISWRIDAQELYEAPDEMLIELRAVVALQHREDALGRK